MLILNPNFTSSFNKILFINIQYAFGLNYNFIQYLNL